jgi:hypothetical protein
MLHQIAVFADNHSGKAFETFLFRHFSLGIEPVGKPREKILPRSRGNESGQRDDPMVSAEDPMSVYTAPTSDLPPQLRKSHSIYELA